MAAGIGTVQYSAIAAKKSLPQLSPEQQGALMKAKQYAMQESVKHVLKKQQIEAGLLPKPGEDGTMTQAMQLQRQQALVLMCRVYVGSIFYDLREEIVRTAFGQFGVIKTINMSFDPITGKHKGFAFIEYETPDAAQLAMEQMSGMLLGGRPIKVGRPSNMPQSHPIIDQILEESKTSKRVYVSSVHEDLSIEDLKSVFSAFGNITSCALAPDPTSGKHKGYGSIEYETLQSAKDAITSMNLFDLGGQNLRVGRGIGPPPPTLKGNSLASNLMGVPSLLDTPAVQSPADNLPITVPLSALPGTIIRPTVAPPKVVIPNILPTQPQQVASVPPPGVITPTLGITHQNFQGNLAELPGVITIPVENTSVTSKIMKLCNMVSVEEIDEDLEAEVTEECGKFGVVKKVIIYKEKQGEEDDAPCIVKIFVEFELSSSTATAVESLNNRWFGGRQIEATLFSESNYSNGDFSG
uniref:poly(U)-binding-splicing factor PUF60-like n=1 Tax=Styela clava TaxID=7725 RepID=UPI0019398658|nr:poly(U)-binding-splicing factor PUF60-like [Styela clava]XP_039271713.1 poly(U)-binding-splicing factor PUF60-like [Styela clava]